MRYKFLRESKINYRGKEIEIEVWQDLDTAKLAIYDKKTGNRITLFGAIGEEV